MLFSTLLMRASTADVSPLAPNVHAGAESGGRAHLCGGDPCDVLVLAERIDPLPAPLTSQQMIDRPYALGAMEIVPVTTPKLNKKGELSPFLLIYNAKTDSGNKPGG